ncbi:MAG: DegT/DnrJ/EryC1/StrS family aminotransferase [Caldilineae bacterium]|nr:MAG: DegT/DnrJ/EryC1/StrS family aminotransferase [Caldilineae bacterium]
MQNVVSQAPVPVRWDDRADLPGSHRPDDLPAVLGGRPAFANSLPFMRPTLPNWHTVSGAVQELFDTGMLTKGRHVRQFEEKVACYLGVRHAVAVSSCTAGLMLVYRALGLKGEVLVPSFTFMATVHPLLWLGVTPVFVDIDPHTWNVDPARLEEAITPRTTAIVAVHVFGNPANIEALEAIAARHNLLLLFDAAHGFGALHNGSPVGRYGAAEVFSTSPTKLLVTGEGGIVATNRDDLARRVRIGREYGNPGDYNSLFPGMNARMQEFSALLGLYSLDMLEHNAFQRNHLAEAYRTCLSAVPGITFQTVEPVNRSSYKDFSICIDPAAFGMTRDALRKALEAEGIHTRTYYVPPVHRHTACRALRAQQRPHLPVTEELAGRVLSLPIYSHMPVEVVTRVCDAIRRIHTYARHIRGRFPVPH